MAWWLLVSENSRGEWSVGDAIRDYRICHYNHERHSGAHLHHPLDAPAGARVAVSTVEYATLIVRLFAQRTDRYDEPRLKEVIHQWKSA